MLAVLRAHINFVLGYDYTSAEMKQKAVSCNQSETSSLVSDWLKLTGLGWVPTELTAN